MKLIAITRACLPALLLTLETPTEAWAEPLDNWFTRALGSPNEFRAVAYGNGMFCTVGLGGGVWASTNGVNWESRNLAPALDRLCIGYGNGLFLTAPVQPYSNTTNVLLSTDTSTWIGLYPSNGASFFGANYCGGVYFLVGNSATILTATNFDVSCAGKATNCNWTLRHNGGGANLRGAEYGNGVYVVVGDNVSMTSTDLRSWTTNSVFGSGAWDVAFGNGMFVAALGSPGRIYTSTNGINWTQRFQSTSYSLYRLAFGNGSFVAVGSGGAVVTSGDGITWTRRTPPMVHNLRGVAYGGGAFVATGESGLILQSGLVSVPVLGATKDANRGGIALTMSGEIGRGYRIQTRTNLAEGDWEDFLSFTNSAPTMEFLDTSTTNLPSRFYRAVSP